MCVWNPVKSHMVRGFGRLVCCWLWKFGLCFSSNEEFIEFWQKAACEFLKLCRRTASYTLLSSGELHLLTGVQADSRSSCRKVHFGRMRDRRWGRGGAHAPPPPARTLAAQAHSDHCYSLSMTCTIRKRLIDIHYVLLTESGSFLKCITETFPLENV